MIAKRDYKFWFCTGSQDLYGDVCLSHVAEHSKIIVAKLNESGILPYDGWQMYMHFLRELISERKICFKDFVRYSVFYISPKLYELLSSKLRKRKP